MCSVLRVELSTVSILLQDNAGAYPDGNVNSDIQQCFRAKDDRYTNKAEVIV